MTEPASSPRALGHRLRRWLRPNAAVREHLVLVLTVVAAVLATVAGVSYMLITQAENNALAVYERRVLPTNGLRMISDSYAIRVVDTVHKVSAFGLDISEGARHIQQAIDNGDEGWRSFVAHSDSTAAEMQPLLLRARASAEHARDLMLSADWRALDAYRTQLMYPAIEPLTDLLARQVQLELRDTDDLVRETRARLRGLRFGASLTLICVALLGWVYVASFSRSLSRSIGTIERLVRRVAAGDLTGRAAEQVDPAFAGMAADIDSMIQALERSRTELIDRSAELERAAQEARGANAAKSLFLSSMSHELRTPLNVILGYAQVLAREPQRSQSDRHALRRVTQAGAHLLGLIEDVLSLSKIEAGQLVLRPQAFETQALVDTLEGMFAERAQQKGLRLCIAADPSTPAWLYADAARLRQVLVNLIGNAVKFTERGEVRARLWCEAGRLHATVTDTGPGISPEELPGLFKSFMQGAAGHQATEGTGLGLYISRALIRLMGGELSVTSQLGAGSEFRFDVAAQPTAAVTSSTSRPLVLAPGTRSSPMLVADDRADNREVLSRLLQQMGFEVETVPDGYAAIEACARASYAIVWMDLRMAALDGQKAMSRIREADARAGRPARKIIAVTASVIGLDRQRARASGFDEVVVKPFSAAEIAALIAATLEVRFVACGAEQQPQAVSAGSAELEGLAQLPHSLRAELLSALVAGDADLARSVIGKIDAQKLSGVLRTLVDGYAYDAVIASLRGMEARFERTQAGERA